MIMINRLMMTSDAWTKKFRDAVLSGTPEDGNKSTGLIKRGFNYDV